MRRSAQTLVATGIAVLSALGWPIPVALAQTRQAASVGTDYQPSTSKSAPDAAVVLSASAVAALIVQQSRSAYYATGHPCACPDDLTRSGRDAEPQAHIADPAVRLPNATQATLANVRLKIFSTG